MKQTKKSRLAKWAAAGFWLAVWQAAAMAVGQEVFLVSPVQTLGTLLELLPQAEFWQRIGFSAGRILLGFGLGAVFSVVLAVAAGRWAWVEALLAPVMQLVKATPVASFIILALVWVSGSSLSVLISFLMVLPVLYGAVRTGIGSAYVQLLEMAKVVRLPLGRRLRAIWLPAVLPAFRQGCSVALGICWKSGVAAEVIGRHPFRWCRRDRRCAVPCQDHPFHRGAVRLDFCHHPAERGVRKAVPGPAGQSCGPCAGGRGGVKCNTNWKFRI